MSTKSRPDKRPLLFPASGRIMPFTGLRTDNQAFLYPVSGRIIRHFYIQYPPGESGLFIISGMMAVSGLNRICLTWYLKFRHLSAAGLIRNHMFPKEANMLYVKKKHELKKVQSETLQIIFA